MLDAATATVPTSSTSVKAKRLPLKRYFTTTTSPYDEVEWEMRDVVMKDLDGEIIFEQYGVEVPKFWSQNATNIVASKYFRGHGEKRESSVRQLIDRVVVTIATAAVENRYLSDDAGKILEDELRFMCLNQMMAFNSPVWFNVGAEENPQSSACFILSVDDTMESILNLATEEGYVFRKGSGAGVNISRIREKNARLSGGGYASGPLSFALGWDRSAAAIKSGGKTRRAAKMLVMNDDHPDIEAFVMTKVEAEKVVQALIAAGFSPEFNKEGGAYDLAPWQNANNSVRISDAFMKAVEEGSSWGLKSRVPDGGVARMVNARDLFGKIAEAAWACGDPGLQFHDTVNEWHTCSADGQIVASNPCSEFMFLDNSACNLASLNLMKFRKDDGAFDVDAFKAGVEFTILAQETLISFSGFPTENITREAKKYRTLGIGFANLGALLMSLGLPYNSTKGRDLAGSITSLMSATSYRMSGQIAEKVGAFEGFFRNREPMTEVLKMHLAANDDHASRSMFSDIFTEAHDEWEAAITYANSTGMRNAQASVLAPTGTISFMMDCDTTGIEPDLALVKYKKLVGGGSMKIVNQGVGMALRNIGYSAENVADIIAYIEANDTIEGSPHIKDKDLAVFDCSLKPKRGDRSISAMGHVNMMAACQPFLSGAISKTVNMPSESTVEDVKQMYMEAWRMGLKAIAIYRDGCKESQPLNVDAETAPRSVAAGELHRRPMPNDRMASVHKFGLNGHNGYLTLGYYPDGQLGEVFVNVSKQGSTLNGLLDGWATLFSIAIQWGIPVDTLTEKFKHTSFEPAGFTGNPDVPSATSLLDYIARIVEMRTTAEPGSPSASVAKPSVPVREGRRVVSGPPCLACGHMTVRAGSCHKCDNCGDTTGCG